MCPRPRPEIIGTNAPQAARIGAEQQAHLVAHPAGRVLVEHGAGQAGVAPIQHVAGAGHRAGQGHPLGRRHPSPDDRHGQRADLGVGHASRRRSRTPAPRSPRRELSPIALSPDELGGQHRRDEFQQQAGQVAGAGLGGPQRLLVAERLIAHPLGQVGDRPTPRRPAGRSGARGSSPGPSTCPRRRPRAPEGADLRRRLEARAADGQVHALGEIDADLSAPTPGAGRAGRGHRRRAAEGNRGPIASSFGPIRRFAPVRLMWSMIAMSEPGPTAGCSDPAALVSTRVEAPAARKRPDRHPQRLGVAALVQVRAALKHRDRDAADATQHGAPGVSRHGRAGKARQVFVARPRRHPPRRRPPRPGPSPARRRRGASRGSRLKRPAVERAGQELAQGRLSSAPGTPASRRPRTRTAAAGNPRTAGRRPRRSATTATR